jgi:hypothetical protein
MTISPTALKLDVNMSYVRFSLQACHQTCLVHIRAEPPVSQALLVPCLVWHPLPTPDMSAFRDRGVPGPTSEMSPRAPAQMGRRETEREGGKQAAGARERWKSRGLRVCPAPRSGALAVGGYKRPRGRGASGLTRAPVPSSSPRGQPSVRGPWSFLL